MKKENPFGCTLLFCCEDCKHWKSYLDTENEKIETSTCKRADGWIVRFAPVAGGKHPSPAQLICSDFEPKKEYEHYYDGFKNYFSRYLRYWNLGRKQQPLVSYVPFILAEHESCIYYVKTLDFVYGNLWDEYDRFNAVIRFYHKFTGKMASIPTWEDLYEPVEVFPADSID